MSTSNIFNWLFGIFGLVGSLYGILGYYETRQNGLILFSVEQPTINKPFKNFKVASVYEDKKIDADEVIEEIIVTAWNAGNVSVKGDDIRHPFSVSGSSVGSIIDIKLVDQRMLSKQNLEAMRNDDNGLAVRWRILDPGEGFRVAVLHKAGGHGVGVSGNFGPSIKFRSFVAGRLEIATALVIPTVLLPALLFAIRSKLRTGKFFPESNLYENEVGTVKVRRLRFIEKALLTGGWIVFIFMTSLLVTIKVPVGGDQLSPFSTWPGSR